MSPRVFSTSAIEPNITKLVNLAQFPRHSAHVRIAVADTGGTSKGFTEITVEANGTALLSKGHTDLFDAKGAPVGQYFQILLIYPENGTLRGDYLDGVHVIHYTHAAMMPGKSVTLSSSPSDGPVFQLTYKLQASDALEVTFGMIPPGQSTFQPIASGRLHKS
jgi:hypothetical protein